MQVPGPRLESEVSYNSLIVLGIYPNPTTDAADVQFYLSTKNDVQISLTDVSGKNVFSKNEPGVEEGLHVFKVDLTSLSNGVYILNVRTGTSEFTRKILKE
jgi:hypothetical protein